MIQKKYFWSKLTKNEKVHEKICKRIQKKVIQQCTEENKSNELKNVEVDAVVIFLKDKWKVLLMMMTMFYVHHDDVVNKQGKIIGFK